MNLQINVTSETTPAEYRALAACFSILAGGSGNVLADPAPQTSLPPVVETQVAAEPVETNEQVKATRTRRTKAAEPVVEPTPEAPPAEVVDTATGEITQAAAPDVAPEEFEAASPAKGKTYGEAEVQQLATIVARTKGPQIVKDKIAALGAARIAALSADQLNELGAYLETQK